MDNKTYRKWYGIHIMLTTYSLPHLEIWEKKNRVRNDLCGRHSYSQSWASYSLCCKSNGREENMNYRKKNNHSFVELVATNKSHKITKQEIQPPTHLLAIHLLTHPCTQEENSRGWTIILWTSFWHFWWSDQENKL